MAETMIDATWHKRTNNEYGKGIAVDAAGNAYVAGYTGSKENYRFPVKVGPGLTCNGKAETDAFVAKVRFCNPAFSVFLPLVARGQ